MHYLKFDIVSSFWGTREGWGTCLSHILLCTEYLCASKIPILELYSPNVMVFGCLAFQLGLAEVLWLGLVCYKRAKEIRTLHHVGTQ